jgi:hypothetical protein
LTDYEGHFPGTSSGMKAARRVGVGVVIALAWVGLAYCAGPTDAHGYRRTAVEMAQASVNAVRTAALVGVADHNGKLVDPYFSVLIGRSAGAVAGAQDELAAESPPDDATRALRDELTPMLVEAAKAIGDLELATAGGDDAQIDGVVAQLRQVGDRLDDFVERHR